jgi:hypothetical protein
MIKLSRILWKRIKKRSINISAWKIHKMLNECGKLSGARKGFRSCGKRYSSYCAELVRRLLEPIISEHLRMQ